MTAPGESRTVRVRPAACARSRPAGPTRPAINRQSGRRSAARARNWSTETDSLCRAERPERGEAILPMIAPCPTGPTVRENRSRPADRLETRTPCERRGMIHSGQAAFPTREGGLNSAVKPGARADGYGRRGQAQGRRSKRACGPRSWRVVQPHSGPSDEQTMTDTNRVQA